MALPGICRIAVPLWRKSIAISAVALPYTLVPWRSFQDLQNAPKGKFPYIEDNGKTIADSSFIIEYLKATYGDTLGDHLFGPRDQAIAHSLRRMMEENLYWVLTYSQWQEEAAWEAYKPVILGTLPPTERQIAETQFREVVRGYLHAQGMGRHSRAEVYATGTPISQRCRLIWRRSRTSWENSRQPQMRRPMPSSAACWGCPTSRRSRRICDAAESRGLLPADTGAILLRQTQTVGDAEAGTEGDG